MTMDFQRLKLWTLSLIALLVLIGSVMWVQTRIDAVVTEDKLVDTVTMEGADPVVTFTTVALGGFRGLLADMLWLRTASLQDQGKYFEMVQLASWITKLQPKFTGATAYLAWNMAYNISVTFTSFEERWKWVQRGIELIRDEALNYNKNDPLLYRELGWIYQHKIGNVLDDAQRYYKFQIAMEMMKAYGGVPNPDWTALAAAPKTNIEFRKLYPAESPIWKILADQKYTSLGDLSRAFRETGRLPDSLHAVLPQGDKTALENFLRAKWLRDYYKLEPATVLEINKTYGDLDWRLSDSFAIYWATLGIRYSPKGQSIDCDRMITQSIKESFVAGRILLPEKNPTPDNYILIPNLDLVDTVRKTYLEAYERNKASTFKSALDNFMKDAIVQLYTYGKYSKAREYFDILRKEHRHNPLYADLDRFVIREWSEDVRDGGYKYMFGMIEGLIGRSCMLLAYGDRNGAEAHLKLAKLVYDRFARENKDVDRTKLPPFADLKRNITMFYIENFPSVSAALRAELKTEGAKIPEEPSAGKEKNEPSDPKK